MLDPVANTASQTRTHGYMVWDTLYGLDADYIARPQMLAGHAMESRRNEERLAQQMATDIEREDCVMALEYPARGKLNDAQKAGLLRIVADRHQFDAGRG